MRFSILFPTVWTRPRFRKLSRAGSFFVPNLLCLEDRLVPDAASIGPNGINALGLQLDGTNISIGQVERTRPGLADVGDTAPYLHPDVIPQNVFFIDTAPVADVGIDDHATGVAGVMIAKSSGPQPGVAPEAYLFSSQAAYNLGQTPTTAYLVAMQHVALRNPFGGDPAGSVRAVNLSFGLVDSGGPFDGTAFVTLGLDWSARIHDVLYVKSGNNQSDLTNRDPLDNYNGLNVTSSAKNGNGIFDRVSQLSAFLNDANGRRLIDLVAPGEGIFQARAGGGYGIESGTSIAAPHATGTVALLQQYAEALIAAGAAGWDLNARHHQVMKAVLMNSADKVAFGSGGPGALNNLIGMRRTIYKNDGTIWLQSDASDEPGNLGGQPLPLDAQLGTGQLNAARALNQFKSGKTGVPGPGGTVPAIGWDYGATLGTGNIQKYPLGNLTKNYVSITLAWDRWVGLTETPPPVGRLNFYEPNLDSFTPGGAPPDTELTNLDVYLVPAGGTINQAVWKSNSTIYNVEHMFFQVPNPGSYEIWVKQEDQSTHGSINYGLAWWAQSAPAVGGVGVNQGAIQRSRTTSLAVTFDTQVTFAGAVTNAFTLSRVGGGAVGGFAASAATVNGVTVVTLNGFIGAETEFGSLADGYFVARVRANQVSANGQQLDGDGDGTGGDDYTLTGTRANGLFRLFGDANGDGNVSGSDYGLFRLAYGTNFGDPGYVDYFDFDGNGSISGIDNGNFRLRFGTGLP